MFSFTLKCYLNLYSINIDNSFEIKLHFDMCFFLVYKRRIVFTIQQKSRGGKVKIIIKHEKG